MKKHLTSYSTIVLCALLGTTTLAAERKRASEPLTLSNKSMSLIIAPDGKVSLKRDGKRVSNSRSKGWTINNWAARRQSKPGTIYSLDNMAKIGPNKIMLWSSKEHFEVKISITPKERYFKVELLHVSNDAEAGGLNNDWAGHRVEFDLRTDSQSDGWQIKTLLLNPYSELNTRSPHRSENGIGFKWPYPQWSQTEKYPQPQGMVAFYGFTSDAEYDDIMADIWVAEPSLPRPNRAHLKSWTRKDVDAWMDNWMTKFGKPWRMFSFQPQNNPENLYKIVDVAQKAGINRIKLHNRGGWQGDSPGSFDKKHFPNGAADARKWADYCNERGIDVHLHGFGQMIQYDDPKYGRYVLHDGLARSAQGTLIKDAASDKQSLLIKPDLTFWPGMKPGMLPHYSQPPWGGCNGGLGNVFPPYYESNASTLKIGKSLYFYTVKLTEDDMWEVKLVRKLVGPKPTLTAGTLVEFMVMGTSGWFAPDSRHPLFEQIAKEYAEALNQIRGNPHYDGAGWAGDVGTWGIRKFTQMVYENLDHPVDTGTGSSCGGHLFGDIEHQFRKVQNLYKGRKATLPVAQESDASYASSLDDATYAMNKGVISKDLTIRGNHQGITVEDPKGHGLWDEFMKISYIWSEMKPHLSQESIVLIAPPTKKFGTHKKKKGEDIYVASENDTHWFMTKTRAMRRKGIDAGWQHIPERPDAAPRQFFIADGNALEGLENPYAEQTPEIELHVMAAMSADNQANVSLMPKHAKDIVISKNSGQPLTFEDGKLELHVDNSQSKTEYVFYSKSKHSGKKESGYWMASSVVGSKNFDMSNSRGFAVTVEGDGSGAVLLVTAGASFSRTYAIDIDFTGTRTVEIPNGEAVNNRYGFDSHAGKVITAFRFAKVDRFGAYLFKVPAGKKTNVKIVDIKAMKEDRNVGLVDPVLMLNSTKMTLNGTIPYNHYLVYKGGAVANVYGPNWHFVKDLPVAVEGDVKALLGSNTFSVSSKSPSTFLSSRVKVKDLENIMEVKKP